MRQGIITILSDVGGIYKITSFFVLVPLGVALYTHDWVGSGVFLLLLFYFAGIGHLLDRLPQYREYTRLSSAFASIALAWLTSGIVFGIPYYINADMSFSQAAFEGMAGWTTTSFSFLSITEQADLTSSLFFWRAYTQWIGGFSMLCIFIALMKSDQSPHERRHEHIITSLQIAIKKVLPYYLIFSLIAWCAIFVQNVSLFDSIYLMLSSVSTGGFVPHPGNIMFYDNLSLEMILICTMIASALPLPLYSTLLFQRDISVLVRKKQVLLLFILILLTTSIVGYNILSSMSQVGSSFEFWTAVRYSLFMSVAAATTTGFWNTTLGGWNDVSLILIMLLIFVGGPTMSMAGGIKLRRGILWFAGLTWWIRQIFAPSHAMVPLFFEGRRIGTRDANLQISKNVIVIVSSVLLIGVATLLSVHVQPEIDVLPLIFDSVSAFGTCGISLGYFTADMPVLSIWLGIFLMWAGKLEMIPVIMLIMVLFRRAD
jgi:trk system potassium uptake protein TrkH